MDLIDAILTFGDVIDLIPADAIDSAHREQMVVALNSIRPALELAISGNWEQLEADTCARYANASSSLMSQVQLTAPGPERNCMDSLAELVGASVKKLHDRDLEPIEAGRLLDLIRAAIPLLQRKPG